MPTALYYAAPDVASDVRSDGGLDAVSRETRLGRYCDLFDCTLVTERPRSVSCWALWMGDDGLELLQPGWEKHGLRMSAASLGKRRHGRDLLGRACGLKRIGGRPSILDACAGWGVDGYQLAQRGALVTCVERQPVVWALLDDWIAREWPDGSGTRFGDVAKLLGEPTSYDIVYLDPMFAETKASVATRRRVAALRSLCGSTRDDDTESLVSRAQARARFRVVLKRRPGDPEVLHPVGSILGKMVRYDIYPGLGKL